MSSTNVQNGSRDGLPVTTGIFPPQHAASQLFGATPLTDETSTQFTFGIVVQPTDAFTVTLDYYFIALDDRIWVSSRFDVGPAERAQLIALGVLGADQLTRVKFFTNDMDTETSGIDLVATYDIDWVGGNTLFSLAANVNKSKVVRRTDRQSDPTDPTPVYYLSDTDVFVCPGTNGFWMLFDKRGKRINLATGEVWDVLCSDPAIRLAAELVIT
ncbi:MAG: TonB-dependent receptor [Proteobacteria bacterium]|nr:TonB-dependent receptor [Pseudomonadota bacterium]